MILPNLNDLGVIFECCELGICYIDTFLLFRLMFFQAKFINQDFGGWTSSWVDKLTYFAIPVPLYLRIQLLE